jgi:hypothetical protein
LTTKDVAVVCGGTKDVGKKINLQMAWDS